VSLRTPTASVIRRKPKSSSAIPLPSTESFENRQEVGTAAFPPPLHSLDVAGVSLPGTLSRAGQERVVRFEDEAEVRASVERTVIPNGSSVDVTRGLKTGYSSSVAHTVSEQHDDLRWSSLLSRVSQMHDCEYITRQLQQHFALQFVHHSAVDPCTPRLLQLAGTHVWHILSRAAHTASHMKHGLLQVLQLLSFKCYAPHALSGTLVSSPVDR
jgi:hypothetical protein